MRCTLSGLEKKLIFILILLARFLKEYESLQTLMSRV